MVTEIFDAFFLGSDILTQAKTFGYFLNFDILDICCRLFFMVTDILNGFFVGSDKGKVARTVHGRKGCHKGNNGYSALFFHCTGVWAS